MDREKPTRPQLYTENYRQLREAETRRDAGEENTIRMFSTKWSALKTYTYNITQVEKGIHMHLVIYIYIHIHFEI